MAIQPIKVGNTEIKTGDIYKLNHPIYYDYTTDSTTSESNERFKQICYIKIRMTLNLTDYKRQVIMINFLDIDKHEVEFKHLNYEIISLDELLSIVEIPQRVQSPPQLENGMVIEVGNEKFLLIDDKFFMVSIRSEHGFKIADYERKKFDKNTYTNFISKVYKVKNPYYTQLTANPLFSPSNLELIWESEPIKTMTQSEIEKELGYKIKIDFIK